jgi:hypothetical protein
MTAAPPGKTSSPYDPNFLLAGTRKSSQHRFQNKKAKQYQWIIDIRAILFGYAIKLFRTVPPDRERKAWLPAPFRFFPFLPVRPTGADK